MPAYNESNNIEKAVNDWVKIIKKLQNSKIIVINDGSTDTTNNKLRYLKKQHKELIVINQKNKGHGQATLNGYKEALKTKAEWIFMTDSDNEFTTKDFFNLWDKREKSNFILGYRRKRDNKLFRKIISKLIRLFNRIIFGAYVKDPNIAYRLMNSRYLEKLLPSLPKKSEIPNILLSILAKKDYQNLIHIPIYHKGKKITTLKNLKLINLCLNGIKELILFRLNIYKNIKKINKQKNLIIGAGITGITAARLLAEKQEQVLIIEKRSHIGGLCYDFFNKEKQYAQNYGPHIFRTNSKKIWGFLSKFTNWKNYKHKVLASIDDKMIHVPFNLKNLDILFNKKKAKYLRRKLILFIGKEKSISIFNLKKSKDKDIKKLADYIYTKTYHNYTKKLWGVEPNKLDQTIIDNVKIHISDDDNYFYNFAHQGIPAKGYTSMFKKMLDHKNIQLKLNKKLKKISKINSYKRIIITSPLDEFFLYKFGRLNYRRIFIKFENKKPSQKATVINYPNDHLFTRITEYNKLLDTELKKTLSSKEYPSKNKGFLAYPVLTKENKFLIGKYLKEAKKLKNVYFAGRLAECKYYNMDQACRKAIDLINNV